MKARRTKDRRRRMGRSRSVEATVERELRRMIATLQEGLGAGDSFAKAVASLRRQVIARGGDGRLRDVVCFLSEDRQSAMLAVDWNSDRTLTANFALPGPVTEDAFDAEAYVRLCEG